MGKGAFALAVVSIAACAPSSIAPSSATVRASASRSGSGRSSSSASGSNPGVAGSDPPGGSRGDGVTWEGVNLGFVSAYVLVRGHEAAIVDTGVAGSADEIEASIANVGLAWSAVGHLILTHHHNDHQGSAPDVLERAPNAQGYAGAEDIPQINVPR